MISKIVLCFCFLSFISWGHIDIFEKSKGTLAENTSFNGSFVFDFSISNKQTLSISDICLSRFNVGEDSTASIRLEIINKRTNKLICQTDTTIKNIFNEDIFIQTSCLLFNTKDYQLIISSIGNDKDNSCCFYTPNSLPITSTNNYITLNDCYFFTTSFSQLQIIHSYPMISFGADAQNGINTLMNQNGDTSLDTISNVRNIVISFTEKFNDYTIEKVGLIFLDVGKNNFSNIKFTLYDYTTKNILHTVDTIFTNIHRKPIDVDFRYPFQINKKYILQTKIGNFNDNDNSCLIFKPEKYPFYDNLILSKLHQLFRNELTNPIEDTLAFGINFLLKEKMETLKIEEHIIDSNFWKLYRHENTIQLISETNTIDKTTIYLSNLEGVQIYSNDIVENEFSYNTSLLPEGYYFITLISESKKIRFKFRK
jgi:hypothetical protein